MQSAGYRLHQQRQLARGCLLYTSIDYDNLFAREHSVSLVPPSSETLQLLYTCLLYTSGFGLSRAQKNLEVEKFE